MFRLSGILTEKGVTSKELSEKTGIPISTIHEYRGARKKNRHYLGGFLRRIQFIPWQTL